MTTAELTRRLIDAGLLVPNGKGWKLTAAGKKAGGQFKYSPKHGGYFLWPRSLTIA